MRTSLMFAAAVAALVASPAFAERPQDRYWANGGIFFSTSNSNLRIDSVTLNNIGTTIDLESDIGLPTKKILPYGNLGLRIGKAFRIEGEYFRLARTGNRSLDRNITIGNTTFNAKANVAGLLESTTYRLALDYSPLLTENYELGFGLGAHITDFRVQFLGAGSVTTATGTVTSALAAEERSQLAPLPTISGYGTYVLSPVFALHGRADWLSLKIGDFSGSLFELKANVTARVIENVGIGAGYRYTNYVFKADKTDFSGRLQYEFHGPVVFLEVAF